MKKYIKLPYLQDEINEHTKNDLIRQKNHANHENRLLLSYIYLLVILHSLANDNGDDDDNDNGNDKDDCGDDDDN